MTLPIHMIEIADRDNLPSGHPMRTMAAALQDTFARKGEKGFPDALFEAEANALAAYAGYTGKAFVNDEG